MKNLFANSNFKIAFAAVFFIAGVSSLLGQNNTFQAGLSAVTPETQSVETGPVLDVLPVVLADGYTINLTLIPSLTDFNGYDTPPSIAAVSGNIGSAAGYIELPVVLPDFTIRQVVTTVNVWDNQTVVLGGLITSSVNTTKDKVPIVGDIPLVGKLFQSASKETVKKNLMIFVTSTIVDPAGNRVHSDDQLPFAQTAIPPQPTKDGKVEQMSVKSVETTHTVPANP